MGVLLDLRFGARLLLKDRWFTLVAATALALGIAANNAVFTFVNAVLLRGLPFKDSHRIMAVGSHDARNRNLGLSFLDFENYRAASRSFSDMSLTGQTTFNVSDQGRPPERYAGAFVSANMFRLIDQRRILGHGFVPDDETFGAPPNVILGYGIWQTRYGGDPAIIGGRPRSTIWWRRSAA